MAEPIAVGNIRMRWEADGRRLRCWWAPEGARVGRVEAEAFVGEVQRSPVRPVQVLVDAGARPDITAEYREVVGAYFRAHPDAMVVALVRVPPVVGVMVRMFELLTRVRLRSCRDEQEAVRWLEENSLAGPVAR